MGTTVAPPAKDSPAATGSPVDGADRPAEGSRTIRRVQLAATLVVGTGLLVLLVADGSAAGRIGRAVAATAAVAAVVLVVCRTGRWWRGAVTFVAGAVALAVGVGIGLPHLAKGGSPTTTIAGLAVLAGALVLAATGAGALVRAARPWARVVLIPALLVTVLLALFTVGQAVAATNVPPTPVGSAAWADRGLTATDVRFDTADGVRLAAWYVPSRNRAAVVLLHGAGSNRGDVVDHAAVLADAGFGVLLVDARGHGDSGGRAMDFGWYGDLDVGAALTFLAARPDVDPDRIAALGMSMGGEEALGALAADPRLAAVVAEGATNRVAEDKAWQSDEYGWRGAVQAPIDQLTTGVTDLLTDASPPIPLRRALESAPARPVLLIAGGEVPDEVAADRALRSVAPDHVDLWVVPGAGHTAALATDPDGWRDHVVGFLETALAVER